MPYNGALPVASVADSRYDVRQYRSADRDAFLSLYEQVWGRAKGEAWFEWRFERNPYAAGVEMVVAERDGELVGAEALLRFRLRLGDRELSAYQPVEWIVHPDHRRRGVFSRMTERLIDRYSGRADLLFNFPTDALLPGIRKFDWRVVGAVPKRYRVQCPDALLAHRRKKDGVSGVEVAATVGGPLVSGWLRVRDVLCRTTADVEVERYGSLPVCDLVALARADPPDRLHVVHDRPFYEWRFDNPNWETTTYLARRDGEPVVAVVAATKEFGSVAHTQLLDVQPAGESTERSAAFGALLDELLRDHRDVDVLRAPASVFERALHGRGFLRDDAFPLSAAGVQTTHVVRPLAEDGDLQWEVGGRDLADPDTWRLSLADLEVG